MFRSFQTFVLGLAFAVVGIAGERHSVGFDNACGFGTPTLIGPSGEVLSSGNVHTVNAGLNARAFLQTGDCGSDGARCTMVEMNLGAAQSFVDISLLSGFSVETAFEFVNQCSGRGASCANEDCPNAIRSPSDSSALVMCPSPDVDLLITFCGGSTEQPQPDPQPEPDPEQDPDTTSSSASTTDRDDNSQTTPTPDDSPSTSSETDRELTTPSSPSGSSTQSQPGSSTDNSSSTPTPRDSGSSPAEISNPSETGVNEQQTGDGGNSGDGEGPNGEGEGKKDGGGFGRGALIGVAVAGAVVGVLLVLGLLFCMRKKRRVRMRAQMGTRGALRDDEDCYFDAPNSTAHLTVSPYHQTSAQTYPPIHPDKFPLPSTPAVVTNIPPPTQPSATSPPEGNDTSNSAGLPTSAPTSNHDSTSPTSTDPHDQQRLLDLVRSLQERIDQIDGDGTATQVPPPPYAPQHS